MHKPILFRNLALFPHKNFSVEFNAEIRYGSRIAIIGDNGSGKSTMLKIFAGEIDSDLKIDAVVGYVPQIIDEFLDQSGAERFNRMLTKALSKNPDILLLDEPTNHLDHQNRQGLMRILRSFRGTLIVASHDQGLLREFDTLWYIEDGQIDIFSAGYDDFLRSLASKRALLVRELSDIAREKKVLHESLMKEQNRAKKSKVKGQKSIKERKWPTIVSSAKMGRAQKASGQKKAAIDQKKQDLLERLSGLKRSEIIVPKFSISAIDLGNKAIISVKDGFVGYHQRILIKDINLSLGTRDRIAIIGANASGKSSFAKALLGDKEVVVSGIWVKPRLLEMGYLDQHYKNLDFEKTPYALITDLMPSWSNEMVRSHLNDFLFRKNEEVTTPIKNLSGGEKARLSLAQIAALTPRLLILDEVTNNLDLKTKDHVIEVLNEYPGALIAISHDEDFLERLKITERFHIENGLMKAF